MHYRQQIREGVRDLLLGPSVHPTSAGERVYASRILPHRKFELPVITVYTLEEAVQAGSVDTAPRELTRILPVVIEAWVTPGDTPDEAMDDIAQEIETVMHADPYLGGLVGESILESTDMELIEQGDRMMGLVILTYSVTYRTFAPEPPEEDDMADFVRVDATHALGDPASPANAEDLFEVQEEAAS